MSETDPLLLFSKKLSDLGVRHMVTESVAATIYGVPRQINVIDIVAALTDELARALHTMFPPDAYYLPPEEVLLVELRRTHRGHFNVLYIPTGLKADVYLEGSDKLHQWGLQNVRPVRIEDVLVPLAPPEYVLIRKMVFYNEGKSEKHLREIEFCWARHPSTRPV